MIAVHWLVGVGMALAAAGAAAAQVQPAAGPDAAQKIAACEGQKFEFSAGEQRPTKITLCSEKGAGKDELVKMFESAAARIQQIEKLAPDRKASLVAQLKAKIIEVQAGQAFAAPLPAAKPLLEAAPMREYGQLPPLPPPIRTPTAAQARPTALVLLPKPRLTLECSTPGEIAEGGPCIAFARDTLLTVRADESLPGGTSLRFVRRGDLRAELALAQMRKGQSRRIRLPLEVCAGVTGSNIEIQVVRSGSGAAAAGQVVDTRGPYQLRC